MHGFHSPRGHNVGKGSKKKNIHELNLLLKPWRKKRAMTKSRKKNSLTHKTGNGVGCAQGELSAFGERR